MTRKKGSKNFATLNRMNLIEGLLLKHYSDSDCLQACALRVTAEDPDYLSPKGNALSDKTFRRDIDRVRTRWQEEEDHRRVHRKAAAVKRVMAIARTAPPSVKVQCERLISDIEGTKAPETVNTKLTMSWTDMVQLAKNNPPTEDPS